MPKRKPLKEWIVPVEWKMRGHAFVKARDADEAVAKAEKLEDTEIDPDQHGEYMDHKVTGEAEENV